MLTDRGFEAIRGSLGDLTEEGYRSENHWHDRIDIHSRLMIGFRITTEPSAEWVKNTIIHMIGFDDPPSLLLHDRDEIFSRDLRKQLKRYGIRSVRTPYQAPKANCCSVPAA
ncbi:MAG: hypothetical protein AB7P49_14980 [Bdellovibrionales bacterium]